MKITTEKKNGGMKVNITLNFRIPGILKMVSRKLNSCYENLVEKVKNEFSGSEIIFTKTKTRGEFAFYSWEENPHKLRMKAIRQIKKAPAMTVITLIFQTAMIGVFLFAPPAYTNEPNGDLCPVDVDVILAIDTSGSMADGEETQSKCEWWEQRLDGATYKWFLNTDYDVTEAWCEDKSIPPNRLSTYTLVSNSKINDAKIAANSFIDLLITDESDHQSGLVSFSTIATLDKGLSNDHVATQAAINALIACCGGTNIKDAIALANGEFNINAREEASKVVILLTDGQDSNDAEQEIQDAKNNGYKIFTIGLGDDIDAVMLQHIADETGGQYYYASKSNELSGIYNVIYNEIAWELCQYGSISGCKYLDADADGNITEDEKLIAMPDWEIKLFDGSITTTQQTDASGCYTFAGLLAGDYTVSETLQEGWTQTFPAGNVYNLALTESENKENIDFGNYFSCDDGLWCNGIETYNSETHKCEPGTPSNCDDDNVCTDDYCDEENDQCVNAPNSNQCDDGDACTIDDVCSEGVCSGTPIDCNDGIECTIDSCVNGECQHDTSACACNEDADCDDSNPCTDNTCNLETYTCEFTYNTNQCDDNNLCTENDVCLDGVCSGTPIDCDDDNVCTDDSCDPEIGCVNAPNSNQCDDGDACTENDICSEGVCSGTQMDCDDGIECTIDSCVNGECQHDDSNCPNGSVCGNSILEGDEECDEGENNGDHAICSNSCAFNPQCNDGIDNDGDNLIDFDEDPGCASLEDDSEIDDELLGLISGYKFNDANNNSVWDTEENGLNEWGITLYSGETELLTAITDEDGYYQFSDLEFESYTVKESLKSGWIQTYPVDPNNYYEIELSAGNENSENNNFGNYKEPESGGTSSGGYSPSRKYPDMSVTITDGQETADPEQILEYSITYANIGDTDAKNVEVIDFLPDFVDFISASDNGIYDSENNQVVWNLGDILAGVSKILNLQVKVFSETPAEGTTLTNKVEIKTSSEDSDLSNNQAEDITNIGAVKGAEEEIIEEPEGEIKGEETEILPKAGPDISVIYLLAFVIFGITLKVKRLIAF